MNRKFFILITLLSIGMGALFSGTDPSYSCAPGFDYEKYRISYVDPDLLSDSIYQSFYQMILHDHQTIADNYDVPYKEFYNPDNGWDFREKENIQDWQNYFGGIISTHSIYDLIYQTTSEMIAPLSYSMQIGLPLRSDISNHIVINDWSGPDTLDIESALKEIFHRHDLSFLNYLLYAQECSKHAWAFESSDWWDSECPTKDTISMFELIDKGLVLHRNCRSEFLKLRYAYQLVRTARYAGAYERAMQLYDSLITPNPTRSPIRFWALAHKAGAARLAGHTLLANYYFSQVFDSCEGQREISVRGFKVKNRQEWEDLYSLAQNNHEQATLWMLHGFKEERLTFGYLRKMYELEPNSPHLAIALLRELHRIESYLYDNVETRNWKVKQRGNFIKREYDNGNRINRRTNLEENWYYNGKEILFDRRIAGGKILDTLVIYNERLNTVHAWNTWERDDTIAILSGEEYVSAFRRFVLECAQEGKVLEPALWYMIAGYIDLMGNDFQVADECLDEAERIAVNNDDLHQQIVLLDFMRRVKSRGMIDRDLENKIYPTLHWFHMKQRKNQHSKFDKVMSAIGQQYLVQNDVPRAILAFARSGDWETTAALLNTYADHDDIERLQRLLTEGGKSEYERMLIESLRISKEGLIDLQGTKFLREGKFQEAYNLLKQLPDSYWQNTSRDNFGNYGYRLYNEESIPPLFCPMVFTASPIWFYSSTDTTRFKGENLIDLRFTDSTFSKSAEELHAVKFNKRTFILKILQLQQNAKQHPRRADSTYFQLGNLIFNNWRWNSADITGGWDGSIDEYADETITDYPFNVRGVADRMVRKSQNWPNPRKLAGKYYKLAMEVTQRRELAAHCAYMIDLCNKPPRADLFSGDIIDIQDRTGYNILITKYRDTRFAKQILSQCSVYKYFAQRR